MTEPDRPRALFAPLASPELIVFALATALYSLLGGAGVVWMDAGELTAAAFTLGGAHPPGHPLHTLLGKLAALVPLGEVGFRLNLLSGAAMGAALAGTVALARRLAPARDADAALAAGLVAASLAALTPAALASATRAEVYAPTAALLVWSLVAVLDFAREPAGRARLLLAAAFGCGLAAAIHPVIAAAAALPMAARAIAALGGRARLVVPALALGGLALASYAYLPVRAIAPDRALLVWGEPSSPEAFWSLVTAAAYQRNFSPAGLVERFAGLWQMLGHGTGLGVLLGGGVGLAFAAATRLRGAGPALATAVVVVLGASLQDRINPDLPGYVLPALLVLAAGLAPLVAALLRLLPADLVAGPRGRRIAITALLVPVAAIGLVATSGGDGRAIGGGTGAVPAELDRGDDPTRLHAATVGAMPPGPGVYFAIGDPTLFADHYERLVAGVRPDIAVVNPELCRDEWYVRHVKRALPALFVPFVDDGARGAIAERLARENLRAGRPVGSDRPSFGRRDPALARATGRAFALTLTPVKGPEPTAPPPLSFTGAIGRRVAAQLGLARGEHELARGRLADAGRAAGVLDRFRPDDAARLAGAKPSGERPPLRPLLPRMTALMLYEDWVGDLFADELRWRAGLDEPPGAEAAALAPDALDRMPFERVLHARWRALLSGRLRPGSQPLLDMGSIAAAATTRLLVARGDDAAVEAHLRAALARFPGDAGVAALLASHLANRGDMAGAEALFRRAIELDPSVAESHARLAAVLGAQGKDAEARAAWDRARALDPSLPAAPAR